MTKPDDEVLKEARRLAERDKERADILGLLLKHPGWAVFEEMCNEQLTERGKLLMEPLPANELNAVERAEHNKGAMYGIAFMKDLPRVTCMVAQEARKSDPATDEEDDDA